jgi:hypothetical protein
MCCFSGSSSRDNLDQGTDTQVDCGVCRLWWGVAGERLRLEENEWRTSSSEGGGIVDEKVSFIGAPYSVVWDLGK